MDTDAPSVQQEKDLYEVQVAGLPLKLRSSHDADTVNELIDLVDRKYQQVTGPSQSISFQNALVLTALQLAEDLLLLKKNAQGELDQLEERTQKILSQLEDSPVSQLKLDN